MVRIFSPPPVRLHWYGYTERTVWSEHRWSTVYRCVVKHEGKHYFMLYTRGNTEYQDCDPFYDPEVTLTECHQVEKLVKVWEPVE